VDNRKLIKTLVASGIHAPDIAEILSNLGETAQLEDDLNFLHELSGQSRQTKLITRVKEWIDQQEGWFISSQMVKEIPGLAPGVRDTYLGRLKKEGFIESDRSTAGKFRRIDANADIIDWRNANIDNALKLQWPFELEKYCLLFPGNIVVIAGAGNAGKTAFLLRFAAMNMHSYQTSYFSSEMGDVELKHRLNQFDLRGQMDMDSWCVDFRERSSNFSDVIIPGQINIIDYLEMTDNFYAVGGLIMDIWKKLNGTGLAVISIQKDPKASMGRGGQFSMEKSRLYLNMDYNKLTIVKAKIRKDPSINPNGKAWTFSDIAGGCEFLNIQESQSE
jgi:hypothetical protein